MSRPSHLDALVILRHLIQAGFDSRLVGGCVRDRLLGLEPKDYDIATVATPKDIQEVMKQVGVTTSPTGLKHGTITVLFGHTPYEVTTLRTDSTTDGRHADVAFVESFEEDASRRDFTINAMSEDIDGRLYDYFSGQKDLAAGRIQFVGDPQTRIEEDYLRILRYFRFSARFGFSTAKSTLAVISGASSGLRELSRERVRDEISGLFLCGNISTYIQDMLNSQVLGQLFPGIKDGECGFFDDLTDLDEPVRVLARWSYLMGPRFWDNVWSQSALMEQKLSRRHCYQIVSVLLGLSDDGIPKDVDSASVAFRFVEGFEKKHHDDLFLKLLWPFWWRYGRVFKCSWRLDLEQIYGLVMKNSHLKKAQMPLDGNAIAVLLKLKAGPEIGYWQRILQEGFWDKLWRTEEEARLFLLGRASAASSVDILSSGQGTE